LTTSKTIHRGRGFASSSDFSRAVKQIYGFSPRASSPDRLLQKSKIRQDLLANTGYDFQAASVARNPDRFRVRLVDPLDFGSDTFDLDCCLPVRPLRRR